MFFPKSAGVFCIQRKNDVDYRDDKKNKESEMKKISWNNSNDQAALQALYDRPGYPPEIEKGVAEILDNVFRRGDQALVEYAEKFDRAKLTPAQFRVTGEEIAAAAAQLPASRKKAIRAAVKAVRTFAKLRIPRNWRCSPRPGVMLGEKFTPMQRVGVYIPGGTAPLVSTVVHTAGIASAAGVKEIVAVTPPGADGKVHPAVLFAMKCAGVTEIYRLGGVYGIAAMAHGTESIRKVEKIVGPGNAYVTAAKKLVYGKVAIDMIAGPSEILVIADRTANPAFIAADLLSQAEHGSGLEQAVLVTDDPSLPDRVEAEVLRQKATLPRIETVDRVLDKGVFLITVENMDQAAKLATDYAPEHLEIITENPEAVARNIHAAGAIFLGPWTPEPVGDFCAGPSHVLPTAGSAKYFHGLEVGAFFRRSSLVRYSQKAINAEIPIIEAFAAMEGLDAHGRSGSIRRS